MYLEERYRKNPKNSDTQKIAVIILIRTESFYYRWFGQKDVDRIANSVDPDQTAPDLGLHCLPRPACPEM